MSVCKECHKRNVRDRRNGNIEQHRKYDRNRYRSDPARKQAIAAYQERMKSENPEKWKEMSRARTARFRKKSPEKYRAYVALWNAIRDGKVSKQPCARCPNPVAQAHHADYSSPLDVTWLCAKCHSAHHVEEREAERMAHISGPLAKVMLGISRSGEQK